MISQKEIDEFFDGNFENRFKCRLLEERRWKEFLGDLRNALDQGVEIGEAYKLLKSYYKPQKNLALVPPPLPDDVANPVAPKPERRSKAASREVIQWVFDNILEESVEPEEAPSLGAWGLLMWVRMGPANMTEFYKTIWPKILPSKAQIDEFYSRDEATDDGLIDDIGGMLRDIDAEIAEEDRSLQSNPEGYSRESPVPEEVAVAGGEESGASEGDS